MKKHTLLYVDEMMPDRMKGLVRKRNKILYNIEAIHPPTLEQFNECIVEHKKATLVMAAGRYICIITMGLGAGEVMLLLNLDNNPKGVEYLKKKFTNKRLSERIATAFKAIKNTPDGYYDFEMEVGEIPV